MGRPLNKRYFGPPTDGGDEIRVLFWNGVASVPGWIVKQTGSKKFLCSDGTLEFECMLSDKDGAVDGSHAKAPEDLNLGEMTITVLTDASDAVQVEKISAHKVTADDGNMYPWVFDANLADGAVQIEEAGGTILVIESISLADPAVVTITDHGYTTNDLVIIDGGDMVELATAGVAAGNTYYVDVLTADTFGLYSADGPVTSVDSTLFTAYTTGGTVRTIAPVDV